MTKDKIKSILPYAGIPILGTAFLLIYAMQVDAFIILLCELVISFGYVAAVLDVKTKKIPNRLILAMFAAWVVAMTPKLFADIDTAIELLKDAALGLAVGGGLFLLVYVISRKGLGGGDVKFMAVAGLYIGFAGTLSAMLYGTILAGLTGLVLLLLKKIERKDAIPLSPFLYAGILIAVFYR
jgi:Flp pilus assembly protein protease CpaA